MHLHALYDGLKDLHTIQKPWSWYFNIYGSILQYKGFQARQLPASKFILVATMGAKEKILF